MLDNLGLTIFTLFFAFQNLEFHGAVRFYFQDEDHNVVTKCIRVASSATTKEVVSVLVEKFRPDMRMLTANKYNLYEVHANGGEPQIHGPFPLVPSYFYLTM